jgi:MFS-type transporter involved in bile tolerance (Atg22 family)
MGAVAYYSETEEDSDEPSEFDNILEMTNASPAHYVAVHLIAALTLLFCRIPSFEMIQLLTKDFDQSEEQIQSNLELYNEFCLSVYNRYVEDEEYYDDEK